MHPRLQIAAERYVFVMNLFFWIAHFLHFAFLIEMIFLNVQVFDAAFFKWYKGKDFLDSIIDMEKF